MYAIVNCESESNVNAIQFILKDKSTEKLKYLPPIGKMSGDCQELKITSPIQKIAAHYSTYTSDGTIASISYIKDGRQKTYGTPSGSSREWDFDENEVLIGLYGSTDGRKIMKLGFLTLNKYANAYCDDGEIAPIEEVVVEEVVVK